MEEEKKVSKFSSGINILMRIDFLWKNCHNYKRNGIYGKWNEELDSVWLELARDLKPEEYYDLDEDEKPIYENNEGKKVSKKGYKSKFDSYEQELAKFMPFTDFGSTGFQKISKEAILNRIKQYKLLMEKQLFLSRLENEVGKGTSFAEQEDDWD